MNAVANLFRFISDPVLLMQNISQQQQSVALRRQSTFMRIGPLRAHFIHDPELATQVLIQTGSNFVPHRQIFKSLVPLTGARGLVQLQGEESKNLRKETAPAFRGPDLQNISEIVRRVSTTMISTLPDEVEIDPSSFFQTLVLQTAMEMFVGTGSGGDAELAETFLDLNRQVGRRMRSPLQLPLALPLPTHRKIRALEKRLIQKLRQSLEGNSANELTVIRRILGSGHPDLVDHIRTLLFAGHETTAASLAFTTYLIAQNPEAIPTPYLLTEQNLENLYLESLRLFPPAYMIVRQTLNTQTDILPKAKLGDTVIIPVCTIQRNPSLFSSPEQFLPNRFVDQPPRPQKGFLPFGAGPKSCVGERIALLEARIILGELLSQFRIVQGPSKILCEAHITLHPAAGQKIRMRRHKRELQ